MTSRILVVDDEPLLVETITYNLEKSGFATLRAADGISALALARTAQPDLIVLDLMLPHLSGRDVCRALRQSEANYENEANYGRAVPILILSARSGREEEERCLAAGSNAYMIKPFAMQDLLDKVRTMLKSANSQ